MRKILLVEDEAPLREVYKIILRTSPYDVDVAANGQEALDFCKQKTYDLILLDLMMPVIDGVGFLRRFATINDEAQTKVIVLSNLSSGDELKQAMELGAYKNILKADLSPKQLLSTVRYELES